MDGVDGAVGLLLELFVLVLLFRFFCSRMVRRTRWMSPFVFLIRTVRTAALAIYSGGSVTLILLKRCIADGDL